MYYSDKRAMEKISRISQQIDEYVQNIGKARIGIYAFPALRCREDFSSFLNSLMTALKRVDLRPVYSWCYDANSNAYTLLLLVSGYFRENMNDISEVINRLWNRYSSGSIMNVADIPVNVETLMMDKTIIWQILQQTAFSAKPPSQIPMWHQRHFACCRVC